MKNILEEITKLRLERNWSEYELSKHAGIPQSTISTWYRKGQTLPTLEKVCKGFGITLSQFFAEGDDMIALTDQQREMLDRWSTLNETQQRIILDLLEHM